MTTSSDFYNVFDDKLLLDYVQGNLRIVKALEFAKEKLVEYRCQSVCDIGCGIGWSTLEFSRALPSGKVLGIDLSPVLIETARKVFPEVAENFLQKDLTEYPWPIEEQFDACVLLDVYEHIPAKDRVNFHCELGRILSPGGRVILTCPTIYHQKFLREQEPQNLQPVDEDIDLSVLGQMARDLDAEIIHYEYCDIWYRNNYLHAVLGRQVGREKITGTRPVIPRLESDRQRYLRVQNFMEPDFFTRHNLSEPRKRPYLLNVAAKIKRAFA